MFSVNLLISYVILIQTNVPSPNSWHNCLNAYLHECFTFFRLHSDKDEIIICLVTLHSNSTEHIKCNKHLCFKAAVSPQEAREIAQWLRPLGCSCRGWFGSQVTC